MLKIFYWNKNIQHLNHFIEYKPGTVIRIVEDTDIYTTVD